jgi:hypothetical protein
MVRDEPLSTDASRRDLRPPGHEAGGGIDITGFLGQDARRFFYRWGGHLFSVLIRIRSRFGDDLDLYLIYLVFLLAELSRVIAHGEARAAGARTRFEAPRGLNALSIAEITRIPRESARRKLQRLVALGYVRRAEDGLYFLGDRYGLDAFFCDLKPLFWDGLVPDAEAQPDLTDRAA